MTTVRPVAEADRGAWMALWQGYLDFYETVLGPGVTEETFARLVDEREGMFGLVAEVDGTVAGFTNVVTHPSTWSTDTYVYLEDLFVAAELRGRGIARTLIEAVYERAGDRKVYWQTHESNAAGRRLYDKVAAHDGFLVYERIAG
jgi:GNAT superfamily N-acetyltransferase